MIQLVAFCRSLRVSALVVALALCSAALVASASPASAKSHHGMRHHAYQRHVHHQVRRHYAYHHIRHYRHLAHVSRWDAGVAQMRARGLAGADASIPSSTFSGGMASSGEFGSSSLVSEARRYLGGNPTGRGSLWCARFMNMVLQHEGYHGTGSDMASSFARYGQRVSGPQVGAMHVGIITGVDAQGNPIMISGNNGNRVREAPISRGRIYAYVMPTS
jgi:hypothetical protein